MRNLFGANMTDEDHPQLPIEAFLRAEVPAEQVRRLDEAAEQGEVLEKKASLPLPAKILLWISLIAGVVGARLFLEEVFEEGFTGLAATGLAVGLIGLAIVAAVMAYQYLTNKKANAMAA